MSNKITMMILGFVFTALLAYAGNDIVNTGNANADSIRVLQRKQMKIELEDAKLYLQIAAMATAQGVAVVLDTIYADSVITAQDTIPKDTT